MLRTSVSAVLAIASLAAQDASLPEFAFADAFPAQAKFDRPVHLEHHVSDPDHYYVITQPGHVFRIPVDGDKADRHEFLDWTEKCLAQPAFNDRSNGAGWEEGLLGFAFDPAFSDDRPFVYIYYSEKTGERKDRRGRTRMVRQSVVSRLSVVEREGHPVADPASELRLLELEQPFGNHNGGTIVFGPDRMLYIVIGDGGFRDDPFGHAQNLETLFGSILRIDVQGAKADEPYRIPADNPFVGQDKARGEIYAFGLRNPWRISFDPKTKDLWCADVGQDKFEEVMKIQSGGNYGWNHREGFEAFSRRRQKDEAPEGMIEPLLTYPRDQGISITGGHVYRGKAIPALIGGYLYGDFQTKRVWACWAVPGKDGEEAKIVDLPAAPDLLASWGLDAEGEHLALCFDGRIYRLTHIE